MPLLHPVSVFSAQLRFRFSNIRYLSHHYCNEWCRKKLSPTRSIPLLYNLKPLNYCHGAFNFTQVGTKQFSTGNSLFSEFNFEKDCEETLESLSEHFEELLEGDLLHPNFDEVDDTDVTLASGVLNVHLGRKEGTYVINKQTPNEQIWLSSPVSGPSRFDFCPEKKAWVYTHTGQTLHNLLNEEISRKILKDGAKAGFENCYLGGCDN